MSCTDYSKQWNTFRCLDLDNVVASLFTSGCNETPGGASKLGGSMTLLTGSL